MGWWVGGGTGGQVGQKVFSVAADLLVHQPGAGRPATGNLKSIRPQPNQPVSSLQTHCSLFPKTSLVERCRKLILDSDWS